MIRPAPPKWTWAAATGLAGLALTILALDPAGELHPVSELNLARLNAARDHSRPLVVLIGDSKLQCAVGFDPEITAAVNVAGANAQVIRITRQGASFGTIEPALRAAAAARPDLILLQDDLLLYRYRDTYPKPSIWRERVRQAIHVRLNRPGIEFNRPGSHTGLCSDGPSDKRGLIDAYLRDKAVQETSTPAGRQQYLAWIDNWRSQGTKVVLIGLPRSPLATNLFPDRLKFGDEQTLKDLEEKQGLRRIMPPEILPQSAFGDLAHTDAEGRRIVMAWAGPAIAAELGHE